MKILIFINIVLVSDPITFSSSLPGGKKACCCSENKMSYEAIFKKLKCEQLNQTSTPWQAHLDTMAVAASEICSN